MWYALSSLCKIQIIPIGIIHTVYFVLQNQNYAEWNLPYGFFILLYTVKKVPSGIAHQVLFIQLQNLKMITIRIIHMVYFSFETKPDSSWSQYRNDSLWNHPYGLVFRFTKGEDAYCCLLYTSRCV